MSGFPYSPEDQWQLMHDIDEVVSPRPILDCGTKVNEEDLLLVMTVSKHNSEEDTFSPMPITEEQITKARAELSNLADKYGVPKQPIDVYHQLYLSY
jgi:hypothetical protein